MRSVYTVIENLNDLILRIKTVNIRVVYRKSPRSPNVKDLHDSAVLVVDLPADPSPEGELLASTYLDGTLPSPWRVFDQSLDAIELGLGLDFHFPLLPTGKVRKSEEEDDGPLDPERELHVYYAAKDVGVLLPPVVAGFLRYPVTEDCLLMLTGIRAWLYVLLDAATCPHLALTSDYVGLAPASDVMSAFRVLASIPSRDLVSCLKYQKDWPLAHFMQSGMPAVPPSWSAAGLGPTSNVFSGRVSSYFRSLALRSSSGPESVLTLRALHSLAQSKKGFSSVPLSFVEAALYKHAQQLSTPPRECKGRFSSYRLKLFSDALWRGLDRDQIVDLPAEALEMEPSVAASASTGRADMGKLGDIRRRFLEYPTLGSEETPSFQGFAHPSGRSEVYEVRHALLKGRPRDLFRALVLTPNYKQDFKELADEFLDGAQLGALQDLGPVLDAPPSDHPYLQSPYVHPFARVVPVKEPLKVRIITAMNALFAVLAQPIQARLWTHLRRYPCFALIGEQISTRVLNELGARSLAAGEPPTWGLASADYSAATDSLDIEATRVVFESALSALKLAPEFHDALRAALYEQHLIYPDIYARAKQHNGQLMGSVLSFPILCALNLYTYVEAKYPGLDDHSFGRLLRTRGFFSKLACLVNGDDLLFRSDVPLQASQLPARDLKDPSLYRRWLLTSSSVGFRPSQGKNFIHPTYGTVNSVPLRQIVTYTPSSEFLRTANWVDLDEATPAFVAHHTAQFRVTFDVLPFLNVGLLFGFTKLASQSSRPTYDLVDSYTKSVGGAFSAPAAHAWFLHFHREEVRQLTIHQLGRQVGSPRIVLNLFAAPSRGGLGLPIYPGVSVVFTDDQRRLGTYLLAQAASLTHALEGDVVTTTVLPPRKRDVTPNIGFRPRFQQVGLVPLVGPLPAEAEPLVFDLPVRHRPYTMGRYQVDPEAGDLPRLLLTPSVVRRVTRSHGPGTLTRMSDLDLVHPPSVISGLRMQVLLPPAVEVPRLTTGPSPPAVYDDTWETQSMSLPSSLPLSSDRPRQPSAGRQRQIQGHRAMVLARDTSLERR
jgi:hypothetical protein